MPRLRGAVFAAALFVAAASLPAAELFVVSSGPAYDGRPGRILFAPDSRNAGPPDGLAVRATGPHSLVWEEMRPVVEGARTLLVELTPEFGPVDEAAFSLREFCLTLKSDRPDLKLIVSGRPEAVREAGIEWVADAVEGAAIPSRALVIARGELSSWVTAQGMAGTLLVYDPDPVQAALYWDRLETGIVPDDLLRPDPAGVLPMVREADLATLLLMPPSGIVEVSVPSGWYAEAKRADGSSLHLRRKGDAVAFEWPGSGHWEIVELTRPPSGEGFFADKQSVAGKRSYLLEEVLTRVQLELLRARRALPVYSARTTTLLRIKPGSTGAAIQVKIDGHSLFEDGLETHWAWDALEIEGRPWKGKGAPPLPILQPEVVKVRPFELRPRTEYAYHLHEGHALDGTPALRVDFGPTGDFQAQGLPAYEGSIWVRASDFALLRLDRRQLNLTREMLENEETLTYGRERGVFIPKVVDGRQNLSLLGGWTLLEPRVEYGAVEPVADGESLLQGWMDESRQVLRREEKEWVPMKDRKLPTRYLALGVSRDPGYDTPLPLGGLAWFSLDPDNQYTAVFAGVLGYGNRTYYARHTALTVDGFFLAIPFDDTPWRGGAEVKGETVQARPARMGARALLPVTKAFSLSAGVQEQYDHFERAEDTDPAFAVPQSGLTTTIALAGNLAWRGLSMVASAEGFRRHGYDAWGFPDDPQIHDAGLRYGLTLGKDHYFSERFRLHADASYLDGTDLDRFSYHSGSSMGSSSIRGFASGAAVGEKLIVGHLSQSIVMRPFFNLTVGLDAGRFTSPEEKTLVGLGLSTFFFGPWETVVQAEAGVGLHGDGKDWSLRLLIFKSLN